MMVLLLVVMVVALQITMGVNRKRVRSGYPGDISLLLHLPSPLSSHSSSLPLSLPHLSSTETHPYLPSLPPSLCCTVNPSYLPTLPHSTPSPLHHFPPSPILHHDPPLLSLPSLPPFPRCLPLLPAPRPSSFCFCFFPLIRCLLQLSFAVFSISVT